jgi:hypothetical protein
MVAMGINDANPSPARYVLVDAVLKELCLSGACRPDYVRVLKTKPLCHKNWGATLIAAEYNRRAVDRHRKHWCRLREQMWILNAQLFAQEGASHLRPVGDFAHRTFASSSCAANRRQEGSLSLHSSTLDQCINPADISFLHEPAENRAIQATRMVTMGINDANPSPARYVLVDAVL